MTNNNIESIEATFIKSIESTVIIEINSQPDELLEIDTVGDNDEVKRETEALIEALRRTQVEIDSTDTLKRETYLNTVRRARELIERRKIVKGDRLEDSWAIIQDEAERNWHLLMKDLIDFSFRLQKATKAAWETFNHPYSQS
ncbi:MAG: hypothetical protein V7K47_29765 [Nostoc sp.]